MAYSDDFRPGVTNNGPARAAPNIWPYPGHRTIAEINEPKRAKWRDQYAQQRKSGRRPLASRRAG